MKNCGTLQVKSPREGPPQLYAAFLIGTDNRLAQLISVTTPLEPVPALMLVA